LICRRGVGGALQWYQYWSRFICASPRWYF